MLVVSGFVFLLEVGVQRVLKGNEELGQGEAGVPSLPSCAPAVLGLPKWLPLPSLHEGARWTVGASAELERGSRGWGWRVFGGFTSTFLDPALLAAKQAWPVMLPPCFLLSGE